MKAKIVILGILFTAFLSDCEKEERQPGCPSCAEQATLTSYGDWIFRQEGWDGDSGDDEPISLVDDCGWKIYKGNAGGIGHTYQVSSCNDGVVLIWAYGSLNGLILRKGWTGATTEGIRIGDDKAKVLKAYPQLKPASYSSPDYIFLQYSATGKFIEATFSKDEKLVELYSDTY